MNASVEVRVRVQEWMERLDAFSLRERVLLLLCVLAVLIGAWQLLIELPQEQRREQIQQQRDAVAADTKNQRAQLEALASIDSGESLTRELEQLRNQVAQLDESLASLSQGLVSADQLPEILQEVLVSTTELTIRRVRTLPVEELHLSSSAGDTGSRNDEQGVPSTGVYRHSVELEMAGDYFEVLNFLQRLEGLRWRFYWDRLDYEVADYPMGEILLRVYTLSAEEGLLGV